MGFLGFVPYRPHVVRHSTQPIIEHAWQEIESLTLLGNGADFADYANQGRRYFLDAAKSDWRSAGLLYYYSFLNLAKVLLIKRGVITSQTMMTTAAYHGLSAEPQAPASIADFELTIHPSRGHGRSNLFAVAYEALSGETWPFTSPVHLRLRDVLPYSLEVGQELFTHFGILPALIAVQSLLRKSDTETWFEMAAPAANAPMIQQSAAALALMQVDANNLSDYDAADWLLAMGRPRISLRQHVLLRGPNCADLAEAQAGAMRVLGEFCQVHVLIDRREPQWYFTPRLDLQGARLRWQPLLSDYLFAFCLSTILRYQPHMFRSGSRDQFLAEAWTRQSASSVLRYFLMAMTDPAVMVGSVA